MGEVARVYANSVNVTVGVYVCVSERGSKRGREREESKCVCLIDERVM